LWPQFDGAPDQPAFGLALRFPGFPSAYDAFDELLQHFPDNGRIGVGQALSDSPKMVRDASCFGVKIDRPGQYVRGGKLGLDPLAFGLDQR
jgi:hypothetical protein